MPYRYRDKRVRSVSDLINSLKTQTRFINEPVWFRGQADSKWKLNPRLLRSRPAYTEKYLIDKFKQNAFLILQHHPKEEFDWLFLMQHYSIPTRLLDWTESPLVALYFAAYTKPSNDGALWLLLPATLNRISDYNPEFQKEIPSFDHKRIKLYEPSSLEYEDSSQLNPIAGIAQRNSNRMQAQLGVFTISHRKKVSIDEVGDSNSKQHIWRYIIPKSAKKSIIKELKLLGYSKFQLFPELENISENL